jgi:hypothetical protein
MKKLFFMGCLSLAVLTTLILFSACTRKAVASPKIDTTNNTTAGNRYNEDLSAVRPKYRVETEKQNTDSKTVTKTEVKKNLPKTSNLEVTKKLDKILDTIAVKNRNIRSAPGFRVQIYIGESREEALAVRNTSYKLLPDETPHLIPMLPSYRVRVGDFLDRLEAQKAYAILLREFPTALVVPDKIEIQRQVENDR